MKIRILLLMLAGAAGVGSSYALANDGKGHHEHDQTTTGSCQRDAVFGTAAGPQTFTVTVTHAGRHSSLAPGQVVTVTVGSSGQTVRVTAPGCVNGSSMTARSALVFGGRPPTTTGTTTGTTSTGTTATDTTTTGTTTTSTSHTVRPGGSGNGGRHGRHGHH